MIALLWMSARVFATPDDLSDFDPARVMGGHDTKVPRDPTSRILSTCVCMSQPLEGKKEH